MGPQTIEKMNRVMDVLSVATEPVDAKTLMEAISVKPTAFYSLMQRIKAAQPRIVNVYNPAKRTWSGYFLKEKLNKTDMKEETKAEETPVEVVEQTEKPQAVDKYDHAHTEEGYYDPTAYAAMRAFDNDRISRGDIWEITSSNGNTESYVVLGSRARCATVIEVYFSKYDIFEGEIPECECVQVAGKDVYFNPSKIYTKPAKYFSHKVGEFSEDAFSNLLAYVSLYFGISGVQVLVKTKEVQVEVEKEVPVPVEVEKEVQVPIAVEVPAPTSVTVNGYTEEELAAKIKEAVDAAVFKCEHDIYKELLYKAVGK